MNLSNEITEHAKTLCLDFEDHGAAGVFVIRSKQLDIHPHAHLVAVMGKRNEPAESPEDLREPAAVCVYAVWRTPEDRSGGWFNPAFREFATTAEAMAAMFSGSVFRCMENARAFYDSDEVQHLPPVLPGEDGLVCETVTIAETEQRQPVRVDDIDIVEKEILVATANELPSGRRLIAMTGPCLNELHIHSAAQVDLLILELRAAAARLW